VGGKQKYMLRNSWIKGLWNDTMRETWKIITGGISNTDQELICPIITMVIDRRGYGISRG
jgi:hypothetical protein